MEAVNMNATQATKQKFYAKVATRVRNNDEISTALFGAYSTKGALIALSATTQEEAFAEMAESGYAEFELLCTIGKYKQVPRYTLVTE